MNELLGLLKGLAPAVATAVSGPLGGLAVTAIANKFGVADDVQAVAKAIAGDPDAAQKLAELDLKQFELENADRDSARHMQETALNQEDKFAKHFIYWFAWFWSVGSMTYFFAITFGQVPPSGKDFGNIILGFLLGTAVATIISFFYGSSKSSKDKTDTMSKELLK
jgi:membrane protein required for beta-lactamase induction